MYPCYCVLHYATMQNLAQRCNFRMISEWATAIDALLADIHSNDQSFDRLLSRRVYRPCRYVDWVRLGRNLPYMFRMAAFTSEYGACHRGPIFILSFDPQMLIGSLWNPHLLYIFLPNRLLPKRSTSRLRPIWRFS